MRVVGVVYVLAIVLHLQAESKRVTQRVASTGCGNMSLLDLWARMLSYPEVEGPSQERDASREGLTSAVGGWQSVMGFTPGQVFTRTHAHAHAHVHRGGFGACNRYVCSHVCICVVFVACRQCNVRCFALQLQLQLTRPR